MKKIFLKAILLTFFIFNFMNAQAQDIVLQKLIDTKLLEQKEVKDFKEVQNKIEIKGSTAYLYGLFHCEYKRVTGHFYSSFLADMISIENEKLSEEEQKKENQKFTDYLAKLKECGLINEKQVHYFQKEINISSKDKNVKMSYYWDGTALSIEITTTLLEDL